MKIRTSLLTSSVAFLYLIGIVERPALAMEEAPPYSMNLHDYNTMLNSMELDDSVPEKRAYTYVSEYKRLPVYNFGIGKRWIDTNDNKVGTYLKEEDSFTYYETIYFSNQTFPCWKLPFEKKNIINVRRSYNSPLSLDIANAPILLKCDSTK